MTSRLILSRNDQVTEDFEKDLVMFVELNKDGKPEKIKGAYSGSYEKALKLAEANAATWGAQEAAGKASEALLATLGNRVSALRRAGVGKYKNWGAEKIAAKALEIEEKAIEVALDLWAGERDPSKRDSNQVRNAKKAYDEYRWHFDRQDVLPGDGAAFRSLVDSMLTLFRESGDFIPRTEQMAMVFVSKGGTMVGGALSKGKTLAQAATFLRMVRNGELSPGDIAHYYSAGHLIAGRDADSMGLFGILNRGGYIKRSTPGKGLFRETGVIAAIH